MCNKEGNWASAGSISVLGLVKGGGGMLGVWNRRIAAWMRGQLHDCGYLGRHNHAGPSPTTLSGRNQNEEVRFIIKKLSSKNTTESDTVKVTVRVS